MSIIAPRMSIFPLGVFIIPLGVFIIPTGVFIISPGVFIISPGVFIISPEVIVIPPKVFIIPTVVFFIPTGVGIMPLRVFIMPPVVFIFPPRVFITSVGASIIIENTHPLYRLNARLRQLTPLFLPCNALHLGRQQFPPNFPSFLITPLPLISCKNLLCHIIVFSICLLTMSSSSSNS